MASATIYHGTLDEIVAHYGQVLAGKRLKVTFDEPDTPEKEAVRPMYETTDPQEWAKALYAWATSHDPHTPPLSEEAVSRDSIYEGCGE